MANKRIKLTTEQYGELAEARDWCKRHGWLMASWYEEEIEFHRRRKALPLSAPEAQRQDDDEDRAHRGRDR